MRIANIVRRMVHTSISSKECMALEDKYGCHNYHPLPVVIKEAQGIYVTDCENKRYIDFLSAYSAVNQGHLHPKILETFINQSKKLTLTSRAVHNDLLGRAQKYLAEMFGYDKTLFMNSGVEAGESAIKFARRWGYVKKGVKINDATVLFAKGNFWGRTIAACASSDDPERYLNFGPFNGLNFDLIDYGNIQSLEKQLMKNPNVVAYMMEPIQGEKGVVIPPQGYLSKVKELCKKHNVLLICDEIQTGLGRTGKMLCSEHQNVRPDIVLLGKALSGGFLPVSAVLCDNHIMENIRPGEHGSTYGGNPLACAVTMTALQVIKQEKMVENSHFQGEYLLSHLKQILKGDLIRQIRGKGLFIGVQFKGEKYAGSFAKSLLNNGLIAKPTQKNIIRFSPPLIITRQEVDKSLEIMRRSWEQVSKTQ